MAINLSPVVKKDLLWGGGIIAGAFVLTRVLAARTPSAVAPDPTNTSTLNPNQAGWLAGGGAGGGAYGGQVPYPFNTPYNGTPTPPTGSVPSPPDSSNPLPFGRSGGLLPTRPGDASPNTIPISRGGSVIPGAITNPLPGFTCPQPGQAGYGTYPGCAGYVAPAPVYAPSSRGGPSVSGSPNPIPGR